jgi:HD-GYP domain-containing protein (c-di-GMP phosphodiesterase class II)
MKLHAKLKKRSISAEVRKTMSADMHTAQEFIRHLLSATANAALYSPKHPQVTKLVAAAFTSISKVLQEQPEISIAVIEGELVINGQPQDFSLFLNRFAETMKSSGISHLKIESGLSRAEIETLVSGLARSGDSAAVSSSEHVSVGHVNVRLGNEPGSNSDSASETDHSISISDMPQEELARFMDIYQAVKNHQKLKVNGMFDIVSGFIDAFRQEGDAMLALAALRNTDEYTFTHSTNVCILNIAQAMALGIEGQLLRDIGIAAMLHDIGKLFIPEELITKTDKLTPEEFEIMRQHPALGAKHLLDTPGVPRLAVTTAYEHHLKYNLSGYPKVQAGWQPNLCSQLTMISDFFDALRTRRSYREPMELRKIARLMWNMMGTDLHPGLTRNFLQIIARLIKT